MTLLSLAFACGDVTTVKLGDSGPGETDADADTDSDADTDTDTDTDPTATDFSVWDGARTFSYESERYSCNDTVGESGPELGESSRDLPDLQDLCPSCQHFYAVAPDTDSACDGYIGLGQTWRGLEIDGNTAGVHLFRDEDGFEEYGTDDHGSFDGRIVEYHYEYDYGYGFVIDVTGAVTFPLK